MIFRSFFIYILKQTFRIYFLLGLKYYTLFQRDIVIFDIDNTLADTWPSLNKKFYSTKDKLLYLPIFKNVSDLIQDYIREGKRIIFLSARNYSGYYYTKRWLRQNGIFKFKLVLVESAAEKIFFLKQIRNRKIIFYDDLSFGHELGEVKFYENEILEIKSMTNVEYHGYDFLVDLQNKFYEGKS